MAVAVKNCVILSRHLPSDGMKRSLKNYRLHVVNTPGRYWSPQDAFALAQTRCQGCNPDLIVAVMPLGWMEEFLRLAAYHRITVIKPVMDHASDPPQWTGRWRRLIAVRTIWEDWKP